MDDDRIALDPDVPDQLEETSNDLVTVAYCLHRYMAQQQARRVGERRRFSRSGEGNDATFTVESRDGRPTSVLIESAGGTRGTTGARNVDYVEGLDLLLDRLKMLRALVLDIYIDTTSTKDLAVAERRLDPDGHSYPLDLATIADLKSLRRRLLRSVAKAGRSAESTGGGNARKRTRIVISVDEDWNTVRLADALASGDIPVTAAEATSGS